MRSGLLERLAVGHALAGQLAAAQTERCGGRQHARQHGECDPADPTETATYPDERALVIMRLAAAETVTDDGVVSAHQATAR